MSSAGISLINPHLVFEKISLSEGMRVADFGCGRTGHFVFSASRVVGEKGIVYAVDIMKDVLESLKSRLRSEGYGNVETVWSDIERPGKTAIAPGSLDVCFIVNVLCQVHDRSAVLAEASRLLKPGGLLAITEWARPLGPLGPGEGKLLTPEALSALGLDAQLERVSSFELGDYHYCLILSRK